MSIDKRKRRKNPLMVVVAWRAGAGDDRLKLRGCVEADMSAPLPERPITIREMQTVCSAAKFALAKVLRERHLKLVRKEAAHVD